MSDLWFTTDRVRMVDRLAVEQFKMPSIVLMENAAVSITRVALELILQRDLKAALIVAGPGNNGGDGFAIARHLHNANIPVSVLLAQDHSKYAGDALVNLNILVRMDVPRACAETESDWKGLFSQGDRPRLIVDALLGTGTNRPVTGLLAMLIESINEQTGDTVLAVDLPSGMDADRGIIDGPSVVADATVSLVGMKVGMANRDAQARLGRVVIGDIGVPRTLIESCAVDPPC